MKNIKKISLFSLFIILIVFSLTINTQHISADELGGGEKKVNCAPGQVCLDNPLGDTEADKSPQTLIGKVINGVLGIVGSLALLMFIYGGFTWMTAAGNEQSVTKGKDILIWATVGLIVIFSAYALVKFVFTGIGAG